MCLPVYLSIHVSICLSIHPSIYLSFYVFIHSSMHLSVYPSIHPICIYLFIHPCIYLSIAVPSASVKDQIIIITLHLLQQQLLLLLFIIIITLHLLLLLLLVIIIITLVPTTASLSMLQAVSTDRASVYPRRWAVDLSRAPYSIRVAVAAIVIVVVVAIVASSWSHPINKASSPPMPTAASLQLMVRDYSRVYHIHRRPSPVSSTQQRTIQWWQGPASAAPQTTAPSPAMSTAPVAWVLRRLECEIYR
jgi:hypothetical protein